MSGSLILDFKRSIACLMLRWYVEFAICAAVVVFVLQILCIHLKRFRHEFMFSSKISSQVSFPVENLDMSPYLHKGEEGALGRS